MGTLRRRGFLAGVVATTTGLTGCGDITFGDNTPPPLEVFNFADVEATVAVRALALPSEAVAVDRTIELPPSGDYEFQGFEAGEYRFTVTAFGNSVTEEWSLHPDARSQLAIDVFRDSIEIGTVTG